MTLSTGLRSCLRENRYVCPGTKSGTLLSRGNLFNLLEMYLGRRCTQRKEKYKIKTSDMEDLNNNASPSFQTTQTFTEMCRKRFGFITLKFPSQRCLSFLLACSWRLSKSPWDCMKCRCVSLTQVILGFIGSAFLFKGPQPLEILYCKNSAVSEASLVGRRRSWASIYPDFLSLKGWMTSFKLLRVPSPMALCLISASWPQTGWKREGP